MIPAQAPSLRRFLCCGLVACAGIAGPAAAAAASDAHRGPAALTPNLAGGQFAKDCGNATAAPIFDAAQMSTGLYGVNNVIAVSDPDIVLIGNQWWMIFATGPGPIRDIEPFSAYLPPGASLATTTTYPSDPNGWHIVGALPNGQGQAVPVAPNPSPLGWDVVAAETPSAFVGPSGATTIFYSGHNAGQTAFQIGQMTNFSNGLATGNANPVMSAEKSWEFTNDLGAVSEQAVEWMPQLNEYIMYYTAGGWWATPPQNKIAFAESTDGINWVHRTKVGFSPKYYNQDFLYNPAYGRYEMVLSKAPIFLSGASPRDLVWRDAATPATSVSGWLNEVTLMQYSPTSGGAPWYSAGLLSPAIKYGNLPGETNRLYVFFHSYTPAGDMYIGRFYCDPTQ